MATKKPQTTAKPRYSDEELQDFKALIEKKLESAREKMANLKEQLAKFTEADGATKVWDAPEGTDTSEMEYLMNQISRQHQYIRNLELALVRIENKSYGLCRVTGKLIPKERLRLVPHATLSLEAKVGGMGQPEENKALEELQEAQPSVSLRNTTSQQVPSGNPQLTPLHGAIVTNVNESFINQTTDMQQFKITAPDLEFLVGKQKEIVNKNSTLPMLEHLLIKVTEKQAAFIGTDLEVTCLVHIETESESTFDMLMPFEELKRIAPLVGGEVVIGLDPEGNSFVSCGTDLWCLGKPGVVEDFPAMPEQPRRNTVKLNSGLIPCLNTAAMSVSPDDTRPQLMHVAIDLRKNKATVVSTDAHTLFMNELEVETTVEETLQVSTKTIKALKGFSQVTISWTKERIAFVSDNVTINARRCEQQYPEYRAIIPAQEFKSLTISKLELANALEKCIVVKNTNHQVMMTLASEEVLLETFSLDTGMSAKTKFPAVVDCQVGEVLLSSRLLLRMMDQLKDAGVSKEAQLHFSITHPSRAVTMRVEGNGSMMMLVMPITITN